MCLFCVRVCVDGHKARALAYEIKQEWFGDHSASQRRKGGLRDGARGRRKKEENVGG